MKTAQLFVHVRDPQALAPRVFSREAGGEEVASRRRAA
jgi:hypothetical protein